MKTSPKPQSGIFNPRILTATVRSIVGVSLAMLSFNATASSQKIAPKQQTAANLQPIHGPAAPLPPAAGPAPTGGTLSTSNRTLTTPTPLALCRMPPAKAWALASQHVQ